MKEGASGTVRGSTAWDGVRVLVTGGSGFIGQHLLCRLVALGAVPTAVSRRPPAELLDREKLRSVDFRCLDLLTLDAVDSLLKASKPEVVFHLAGLVKGSRDRAMVLPMLDANLRATVQLMDAAVQAGCRRFITAGSLEEPSDLTSAPASPYAASKLAASAYARLYREHYGLATAVARIFMVYGPGPQDQNKLVPYVVRGLLAGDTLELSAGMRPVDWVFVEDVAAGLVALAESDALEAELGSGVTHTVREVVEQLVTLVASDVEPSFGALQERRNERVRKANLAANRALHWQPETSLELGLQRTIDWFRRLGAEAGS